MFHSSFRYYENPLSGCFNLLNQTILHSTSQMLTKSKITKILNSEKIQSESP